MKLHDVLVLLGVIVIIATTYYINVIAGAYATGTACIVLGLLLSSVYTPKKSEGGDERC